MWVAAARIPISCRMSEVIMRARGHRTTPVLVTADEFGLPDQQEIAAYVNGERRQFARLGDLIFDVPAIIETISAYVPLDPGDLIATGTPAGVGIGFNPPRYLKAGDEIRMSIGGIGDLVNPVV